MAQRRSPSRVTARCGFSRSGLGYYPTLWQALGAAAYVRRSSQGNSEHTIRGVHGWRSPSSIGKVDRGGYSRFIADDACGVPLACQIFCQIHMTGTVAVYAAVSEADLHFPF
jgi:hypothetical protein